MKINGERHPLPVAENGYLRLRRTWRPGDAVLLDLEMPVEQVEAHPAVAADAGRIALQRGPLVYCVEEADNGPRLAHLRIPRKARLKAKRAPDLLGGVTVITGKAKRPEEGGESLYRPGPARRRKTPFTAIPYYAWDHRSPGEMAVWLPAD